MAGNPNIGVFTGDPIIDDALIIFDIDHEVLSFFPEERTSLGGSDAQLAMHAAHKVAASERERRGEMSSEEYEALVGSVFEQVVTIREIDPKV